MAIAHVRTSFWDSVQDEWTLAQKVQNNEFIESGLENWALMSYTTSKIDLDDMKRKVDWFELKKIVLGQVRGDQFIYIYIYISQVWL